MKVEKDKELINKLYNFKSNDKENKFLWDQKDKELKIEIIRIWNKYGDVKTCREKEKEAIKNYEKFLLYFYQDQI